jgi:hypothetical protein
MNVNLRREGMVLMQVNIDGSDYRHILTDTYVRELRDRVPAGIPSDHTPIRLLDLESETEEALVWIPTRTPGQDTVDGVLRVDPHPAWNRDYSMVMVNTFIDGTRRPLVLMMA